MNWTDPIIVDGVSYQFTNVDDDPLHFVIVINKYELYRHINCDEPTECWSLRHLYQKRINGNSSMVWFDHGSVYQGAEITSPFFLSELLKHILAIIH